jgi:phosphohistidine phosphatase
MIKDLYLLRHARASEKMSDQNDRDRLLNSIGLQNATRMGMNFTQKNIQFDIILTSPAFRAATTASLIAEQIKYDTGRVHENDEIYEASVRTLLRVVTQLKEEWKSVLIVGHNPSITYLAEYLTKHDIGDMTTCGVTHIKFDDSKWEEVSEGTGTFVSYEYPDLLNF